MAKHNTLYDKSPKLERNDDGAVAVSKGGDKADSGSDGSSAADDGEVKNTDPHVEERKSMHKRHEEEQKSMHERHEKDMKDMHKRHSEVKEPTGETEINKTENDSKE